MFPSPSGWASFCRGFYLTSHKSRALHSWKLSSKVRAIEIFNNACRTRVKSAPRLFRPDLKHTISARQKETRFLPQHRWISKDFFGSHTMHTFESRMLLKQIFRLSIAFNRFCYWKSVESKRHIVILCLFRTWCTSFFWTSINTVVLFRSSIIVTHPYLKRPW